MKRFFAIVVCLLMVAALVACTGTKPAETPADSPNTSLNAFVSIPSFRCVDVPCALM